MFHWKDDALWEAIGNKDPQAVRRALQQGADPNMLCPDSWVRANCWVDVDVCCTVIFPLNAGGRW